MIFYVEGRAQHELGRNEYAHSLSVEKQRPFPKPGGGSKCGVLLFVSICIVFAGILYWASAIVIVSRIRKTRQVEKRLQSNVFKWQCSDDCSCLPPTTSKYSVTMHQSYKSSNPQHWHEGWKFHRQSWMELHPEWRFIFWTDEENELLAKCIGYKDILRGRSGIQKADLSRMMYLYKYGGFYSDMDYIAVRNHQELFDEMKENEVNQMQIMLQGRQEQVIGFEWGFARSAEHPLWLFCLDIANRQKGPARTGCPIFYTGPKLLGRCVKKYFKVKNELKHMVSYGNKDLIILEPNLVAPIGAYDFTSECGEWRNTSAWHVGQDEIWGEQWGKSRCKQELLHNGTYAVTIYSHSWGEGLKC